MLDARRKRLWFRCHHCGMAENDVIFGRFAERHLEALSDDQLDRLERLLEENDVDLFKWVTGKAGVPAAFDHDVMALLRASAEERD
ncbi:MAG: succinate dehydrogenase assembly factor 2 [Rhodobacterales bacterium]|nr:succinate dehydrogenase assembly factor 2 [Rhodobacterales bacterium]